jgi:signal transduction histidine kinase
MTFRYILEGYDRDWHDAGTRREASYTNLPPGDFRFRVTACNADGTCNESGESVAFLLVPSFYERVWFPPLCAASVAAMIWLAHQFRVRRLREQFDMILAERSRIARELHDTLIQGFSGVTMGMQALSTSLPPSTEQSMLKEIVQDAGNCLREARHSIAGLRVRAAKPGLAAAISQVATRITETTGIRLKLKLEQSPRALPAEIEYNLVRIAQEAISNSVKHSGARTIEVGLRCTTGLLHLSVHDDGRGFEEIANHVAPPGHYGLTGMKERASHIGAEFQLVTGMGRGATVSVLLPTSRREG